MRSDDSLCRPLFDFAEADSFHGWRSIDDGVMGGVSHSSLKPCEEYAAACFQGELSLENGGGFASVHADVPAGTLAACTAVKIHLLGDGHRYSLRLRQADSFDGISWRHDFVGVKGQWYSAMLPLAAFEPVFRGRRLTTVSPIQPDRLCRLGLLIGGGQLGAFTLRIRRIDQLLAPPGTGAYEDAEE